MKIFSFISIAVSAIFLFSCNEEIKNKNVETDSVQVQKKTDCSNFSLEDFLTIKNEAELKQRFGKDHVIYDTVMEVQNELYKEMLLPKNKINFETYIDKGTGDEVELIWNDSLREHGVYAAMITVPLAPVDAYGGVYFVNGWSTKQGIKLGTTADELEKINGKAFVFSGFDLDDMGVALDWKGGNLDKKGINIDLGIDGEYSDRSGNKYDKILYGRKVSSDNPLVWETKPKVLIISVHKPN